jgi:hypothetical protein
MAETKKTKKELIKEAQELADKFDKKKDIIATALDDLDSKKNINDEHIKGMALIEEIFNEMQEIKLEQLKIFEQIKNS